MFKKRILAASLAAMIAISTAACSSGTPSNNNPSGSSDAKVDLTMLAAIYSDSTKDLWQGYIDAFTATHPNITITLEMQSWENINNVIKTKVQAGQAPDILSIDAFSAYAQDDLLYSADQILSQATIDDFQPAFVQNATMNGKQYGFPLIASARALMINNTIFKAAGLDPNNPPKTWDDLKADAKAITDLNQGYYGYGMPLGSEEAQAELAMWILGNGGSYGDPSKLTINTPANVEAVQFMKSLIDAGLTEPDAGSTQRTPMINNLFMQGKIGMAVGLPPFIGMFKSDAPSLDYSIAPMPTKTGAPATLGVADHLMAFNKGDDNKGKAIGAFLDFFFSQANYVKFVDTEGFLPTTKSGASATTHTEFAIFNQLLPAASFYPSINPKWGQT
ncbi:MAG: extracellular solute-binding protein, partial [Propionibacteriaceae bacterium]|nr:extracellular solute-binding protein [Propionibacteriaceae bacterium]